MASPQQRHDPGRSDRTGISPVSYEDHPPVLRLRLAVWDVVGTMAMLTVLFVAAITTDWWSELFGFLKDVCTGDTCPPAPYGIDFYIYPVVWGGIGAAFAAAVIGPFVSLLKGWYMTFWPVLAFSIVMLSSLVGSVLTAFSAPYWR